MKKTSIATLALSLMLGAASTLHAQSSNGTLRGEVLDPSGALIPKAQIKVTNANGFSRTLMSGSEGEFQVQHLTPGTYSVTVSAPGFTPTLEGDIQVTGKKVSAEYIVLGISVNQEIEVTISLPEDKQ